MFRIRLTAEGVVGSPYYYNLYFDGIDAASARTSVAQLFSGIAGLTTTFLVYTMDQEAVTIDPATGSPTASTPIDPFTVTGSLTGEIMPTQVQALVSLRTGVYVAGREIQGRMNIGGLMESQQSNGAFLNPTVVAGIQALFDTYLGTFDPGTNEPVVWSRKNGTTAPVSNFQAQGALATLRSRGARG